MLVEAKSRSKTSSSTNSSTSSPALTRDALGSVSVRLRRKRDDDNRARHSGEFHHLMLHRASQRLTRHSEERQLDQHDEQGEKGAGVEEDEEEEDDWSFIAFSNGVAKVHEVKTTASNLRASSRSPCSKSSMAFEARGSTRRASGLRRGSELLSHLRSNLGSARVRSCNHEFEFVPSLNNLSSKMPKESIFRRSHTQMAMVRKKDSYKKAIYNSQEKLEQQTQLQSQKNRPHEMLQMHQEDGGHQGGRRAARRALANPTMATSSRESTPVKEEEEKKRVLEKSNVASSSVLRGLLWQQRDKLFSKWKQRYFVLNDTELQCRRRDKGLADVVLFTVLMVDIEDMELLDRRGYLTICITTTKEGKIFLRKTEGIREWFTQINTKRQSALSQRGAFTRAAPSTSSWREPLRRAVMTRRQLTDSAGIKDYVMARRMRGLRVSQSNSDSTPDLSHLTSTELFDLYKDEEVDIAARIKDVQHRRSIGNANLINNNLGNGEKNLANNNGVKGNIKRLSLMTDIDLPSLRMQALQGRTAPLAVDDDLVSPTTTMTTTKSSSSSSSPTASNSLRSNRSSSKSLEKRHKHLANTQSPPPLNTGL